MWDSVVVIVVVVSFFCFKKKTKRTKMLLIICYSFAWPISCCAAYGNDLKGPTSVGRSVVVTHNTTATTTTHIHPESPYDHKV